MRNIDDVLDDVTYGVQQLKLAAPTYEVADAYYEGDDPELWISDNLRIFLKENASAFRLNMCSIPVDTVADRLNISSITSPNPSVQAAIDAIIEENDFWGWSNDIMLQAEKYGDMYLGVWLGFDGRPVLSPMDPTTTRIIYDQDLERIPEFVIRYWMEGDAQEPIERATVTYPDEVWKFIKMRGGVWEPFELEDEPYPLPNELMDLPFGHLRNAMPYGRPGAERSYGAQQMITKATLSLVGTMDFAVFPQRWVLKNPDQAQSGNLAAPTRRDGMAAELGGRTSGLQAGPGKLWELIGQSVGEFSPAQLADFRDTVDWAAQKMAQVERLPVRLFSDSSGQQPSGDSARENDRSLKSRISARKRSFGQGIVKAFQQALDMLGFKDAEVNIEWARDEVSTDVTAYEAADAAMSLVERAIANPVLQPFARIKLLELGHTTDEVDLIFNVASPTLSDAGAGDLDSSLVE